MFCLIIPIIVVFQVFKFGQPEIIDLDLCQYEIFQPVCQNGEVIVIESAKYGRMDVGKCVELDEKHSDDPSWIGCSADVTDVLRRKCSARSECSVPVKDKDLEVIERPCYKGLMTYLNVKYQCMTVLSPYDRCNLQVKPEKGSFLISFASVPNRADYCGSKERPWTLEAHAGQTISITGRLIASPLLFESYESCRSGRNTQVKIGYLADKSDRHSEEFCLDRKWDISSHYESKSSSVELILTKPIRSNESFVMIEMTASGCLDLIPAEDAWLKRSEDTATIGCYASRQTWQLRCIGNQWLGVVGNCSMGKLQNQISENNPNPEDSGDNGQVLALASICAFGLVVCTLIVCCGIFCVKRISKGYKKSMDNFHCYGQVTQRHPQVINGFQQTLPDNKDHYSIFKDQSILKSEQDSAYFVLDREELKAPN